MGGDTGHEMTRPQPAEQARQIILEWSKDSRPAAAPRPAIGGGCRARRGNTASVECCTLSAGTRVAGGSASVYGSTVIR